MTDKLLDLDGNVLPNGQVVTGAIRMFATLMRSNTGKFDPIGVDLNEPIREMKITLLKILMAHARAADQPFISLGFQDLIASEIKGKKVFDDNFSWVVAKELGLDGSCGNGRGNFCDQYQISGPTWFFEEQFGIYDPKTETKWSSKAFSLNTPGSTCDALYKCVKAGKPEDFFSGLLSADHMRYQEKKHR